MNSRLPLATSHSLIVLSFDPEAAVLPPGENAAEETAPVWPYKKQMRFKVCASRSSPPVVLLQIYTPHQAST